MEIVRLLSRFGIVAAMSIQPVASPVRAQLPNFQLPTIPVSVEVGLDAGTRALIEKLPEEIRKQFVAAINESLTRLDFSVDTYIKTAQAAATKTVQSITCSADGLLLNAANDLERGVFSLILGDAFQFVRGNKFATPANIDASSQALLETISNTREQISADRASVEIYAAYSDLGFDTAKLICRQRARNAPTEFATDQLELLRRAMGEWRLLSQVNRCLNPDDCQTKRLKEIKDLISREDPKLIEAAAITDEFDFVQRSLAKQPDTRTTWQQLYDSMRQALNLGAGAQYDIVHTEGALLGLRDVELKVAALKSNWQQQAAAQWALTKKTLDPVPHFLAGIAGEMNPSSGGYNMVIDSEHAFNNLGRAKRWVLTSKDALQKAKSLDPRLSNDADKGLAAIEVFEKDIAAKVEQICGIYLNSRIMGAQVFDSRYGAYKWCSANLTNRYALFPMPN